MNTLDSIQTLLEETIDHLPEAVSGNDEAMEAALLAQAKAMSQIALHAARAALRGEPLSPALERSFNVALRAGAQSGRILLQLIRQSKALPARPHPVDSSSEVFKPPTPEEIQAGLQKIRQMQEAGKTPSWQDIFGDPAGLLPPPESLSPPRPAPNPPSVSSSAPRRTARPSLSLCPVHAPSLLQALSQGRCPDCPSLTVSPAPASPSRPPPALGAY